MFYPKQPETLRAQVEHMLSRAAVDPTLAAVPGGPKGLIVPHAGYPYSGPIAASAYSLLRAASTAGPPIERIVLIGPAHRVYVPGVAAAGVDRFNTPLGSVKVDTGWLDRTPEIQVSQRAHAPEHCLEVQLPFLQCILPHARIVPLLVSDASPEVVGDTIERLWGGRETRIVISSDLSHYQPYQSARLLDGETAKRILAMDETLAGDDACGCAAINGLLHVARKRGLRLQLLDLRSSGDTAGTQDEVVGYGSFAFYE